MRRSVGLATVTAGGGGTPCGGCWPQAESAVDTAITAAVRAKEKLGMIHNRYVALREDIRRFLRRSKAAPRSSRG